MSSLRLRIVVGVAVAVGIIGYIAPAGPAASTGTTVLRVLVVKATWGPQPQPDVRALTQPAAAFYAAASFGTIQLAFTETAWLDAYADATICADPSRLLDAGQAAAAQYAPATYDHVIYATPCFGLDFGSDVSRRGTVGLPASASLFEHELGHTFGISHAGALSCEKTCTLAPYANPLDVMGSGVGDFGAIQKAEAGWPINVRDVRIPGTYRLAALEVPTTLPQALVLHRGRVDLWIDHREAVGDDRWLATSIWKRVTAGVLVHETPANPAQIPFVERRPDFLLGNGGPRALWVMHGRTFTVPHVVRIEIVKHVGLTVTLRLTALR